MTNENTGANASAMPRLAIAGRGYWAPQVPNFEAYFAGTRHEEAVKPNCSIVASRMRRATSTLTRMSIDAATEAAKSADLALDQFACVFGSAHGEIQIAVDQMEMMHEGEGQISPARFKNSVHNTAGGLFSIAAKNRGFSTAIAAGPDTFAACLLESALLIGTGEETHVLCVIGDEALPAPIDRFGSHTSQVVALILASAREDQPGFTLRTGATALPEILHTAEPALRLVRALDEGAEATLPIGRGLSATISPAS